MPFPGHETTALVVFDQRTGMMLTGDSFYPGTVRSTRINLNIGTLAVLV
jgi:glyoxylase-like metal-dependent hydrolase (beta-lactamase superfamily II)